MRFRPTPNPESPVLARSESRAEGQKTWSEISGKLHEWYGQYFGPFYEDPYERTDGAWEAFKGVSDGVEPEAMLKLIDFMIGRWRGLQTSGYDVRSTFAHCFRYAVEVADPAISGEILDKVFGLWKEHGRYRWSDDYSYERSNSPLYGWVGEVLQAAVKKAANTGFPARRRSELDPKIESVIRELMNQWDRKQHPLAGNDGRPEMAKVFEAAAGVMVPDLLLTAHRMLFREYLLEIQYEKRNRKWEHYTADQAGHDQGRQYALACALIETAKRVPLEALRGLTNYLEKIYWAGRSGEAELKNHRMPALSAVVLFRLDCSQMPLEPGTDNPVIDKLTEVLYLRESGSSDKRLFVTLGTLPGIRAALRNAQIGDKQLLGLLETLSHEMQAQAGRERTTGAAEKKGEGGTGQGEKELWLGGDGARGEGEEGGEGSVGVSAYRRDGVTEKNTPEIGRADAAAKSEIRIAKLSSTAPQIADFVIPADRRKSRNLAAVDSRLKHAGMTPSLVPYFLLLNSGFFAFGLQSMVSGLRSMVSNFYSPRLMSHGTRHTPQFHLLSALQSPAPNPQTLMVRSEMPPIPSELGTTRDSPSPARSELRGESETVRKVEGLVRDILSSPQETARQRRLVLEAANAIHQALARPAETDVPALLQLAVRALIGLKDDRHHLERAADALRNALENVPVNFLNAQTAPAFSLGLAELFQPEMIRAYPPYVLIAMARLFAHLLPAYPDLLISVYEHGNLDTDGRKKIAEYFQGHVPRAVQAGNPAVWPKLAALFTNEVRKLDTGTPSYGEYNILLMFASLFVDISESVPQEWLPAVFGNVVRIYLFYPQNSHRVMYMGDDSLWKGIRKIFERLNTIAPRGARDYLAGRDFRVPSRIAPAEAKSVFSAEEILPPGFSPDGRQDYLARWADVSTLIPDLRLGPEEIEKFAAGIFDKIESWPWDEDNETSKTNMLAALERLLEMHPSARVRAQLVPRLSGIVRALPARTNAGVRFPERIARPMPRVAAAIAADEIPAALTVLWRDIETLWVDETQTSPVSASRVTEIRKPMAAALGILLLRGAGRMQDYSKDKDELVAKTAEVLMSIVEIPEFSQAANLKGIEDLFNNKQLDDRTVLEMLAGYAGQISANIRRTAEAASKPGGPKAGDGELWMGRKIEEGSQRSEARESQTQDHRPKTIDQETDLFGLQTSDFGFRGIQSMVYGLSAIVSNFYSPRLTSHVTRHTPQFHLLSAPQSPAPNSQTPGLARSEARTGYEDAADYAAEASSGMEVSLKQVIERVQAYLQHFMGESSVIAMVKQLNTAQLPTLTKDLARRLKKAQSKSAADLKIQGGISTLLGAAALRSNDAELGAIYALLADVLLRAKGSTAPVNEIRARALEAMAIVGGRSGQPRRMDIFELLQKIEPAIDDSSSGSHMIRHALFKNWANCVGQLPTELRLQMITYVDLVLKKIREGLQKSSRFQIKSYQNRAFTSAMIEIFRQASEGKRDIVEESGEKGVRFALEELFQMGGPAYPLFLRYGDPSGLRDLLIGSLSDGEVRSQLKTMAANLLAQLGRDTKVDPAGPAGQAPAGGPAADGGELWLSVPGAGDVARSEMRSAAEIFQSIQTPLNIIFSEATTPEEKAGDRFVLGMGNDPAPSIRFAGHNMRSALVKVGPFEAREVLELFLERFKNEGEPFTESSAYLAAGELLTALKPLIAMIPEDALEEEWGHLLRVLSAIRETHLKEIVIEAAARVLLRKSRRDSWRGLDNPAYDELLKVLLLRDWRNDYWVIKNPEVLAGLEDFMRNANLNEEALVSGLKKLGESVRAQILREKELPPGAAGTGPDLRDLWHRTAKSEARAQKTAGELLKDLELVRGDSDAANDQRVKIGDALEKMAGSVEAGELPAISHGVLVSFSQIRSETEQAQYARLRLASVLGRIAERIDAGELPAIAKGLLAGLDQIQADTQFANFARTSIADALGESAKRIEAQELASIAAGLLTALNLVHDRGIHDEDFRTREDTYQARAGLTHALKEVAERAGVETLGEIGTGLVKTFAVEYNINATRAAFQALGLTVQRMRGQQLKDFIGFLKQALSTEKVTDEKFRVMNRILVLAMVRAERRGDEAEVDLNDPLVGEIMHMIYVQDGTGRSAVLRDTGLFEDLCVLLRNRGVDDRRVIETIGDFKRNLEAQKARVERESRQDAPSGEKAPDPGLWWHSVQAQVAPAGISARLPAKSELRRHGVLAGLIRAGKNICAMARWTWTFAAVTVRTPLIVFLMLLVKFRSSWASGIDLDRDPTDIVYLLGRAGKRIRLAHWPGVWKTVLDVRQLPIPISADAPWSPSDSLLQRFTRQVDPQTLSEIAGIIQEELAVRGTSWIIELGRALAIALVRLDRRQGEPVFGDTNDPVTKSLAQLFNNMEVEAKPEALFLYYNRLDAVRVLLANRRLSDAAVVAALENENRGLSAQWLRENTGGPAGQGPGATGELWMREKIDVGSQKSEVRESQTQDHRPETIDQETDLFGLQTSDFGFRGIQSMVSGLRSIVSSSSSSRLLSRRHADTPLRFDSIPIPTPQSPTLARSELREDQQSWASVEAQLKAWYDRYFKGSYDLTKMISEFSPFLNTMTPENKLRTGLFLIARWQEVQKSEPEECDGFAASLAAVVIGLDGDRLETLLEKIHDLWNRHREPGFQTGFSVVPVSPWSHYHYIGQILNDAVGRGMTQNLPSAKKIADALLRQWEEDASANPDARVEMAKIFATAANEMTEPERLDAYRKVFDEWKRLAREGKPPVLAAIAPGIRDHASANRSSLDYALSRLAHRLPIDALREVERELEDGFWKSKIAYLTSEHEISALAYLSAVVLARLERYPRTLPAYQVVIALSEIFGVVRESDFAPLFIEQDILASVRPLLRNTTLTDADVAAALETLAKSLAAQKTRTAAKTGEKQVPGELWMGNGVWGVGDGRNPVVSARSRGLEVPVFAGERGKGKETGGKGEEVQGKEVRRSEVRIREVRSNEVRSEKTGMLSLTSYFLPLTSHFLLLTSYLFPLSAAPLRRHAVTPTRATHYSLLLTSGSFGLPTSGIGLLALRSEARRAGPLAEEFKAALLAELEKIEGDEYEAKKARAEIAHRAINDEALTGLTTAKRDEIASEVLAEVVLSEIRGGRRRAGSHRNRITGALEPSLKRVGVPGLKLIIWQLDSNVQLANRAERGLLSPRGAEKWLINATPSFWLVVASEIPREDMPELIGGLLEILEDSPEDTPDGGMALVTGTSFLHSFIGKVDPDRLGPVLPKLLLLPRTLYKGELEAPQGLKFGFGGVLSTVELAVQRAPLADLGETLAYDILSRIPDTHGAVVPLVNAVACVLLRQSGRREGIVPNDEVAAKLKNLLAGTSDDGRSLVLKYDHLKAIEEVLRNKTITDEQLLTVLGELDRDLLAQDKRENKPAEYKPEQPGQSEPAAGKDIWMTRSEARSIKGQLARIGRLRNQLGQITKTTPDALQRTQEIGDRIREIEKQIQKEEAAGVLKELLAHLDRIFGNSDRANDRRRWLGYLVSENMWRRAPGKQAASAITSSLLKSWDKIQGTSESAISARYGVGDALGAAAGWMPEAELPAFSRELSKRLASIQGRDKAANDIRHLMADKLKTAAARIAVEELPAIASALLAGWDQLDGKEEETISARLSVASALEKVVERIGEKFLPEITAQLFERQDRELRERRAAGMVDYALMSVFVPVAKRIEPGQLPKLSRGVGKRLPLTGRHATSDANAVRKAAASVFKEAAVRMRPEALPAVARQLLKLWGVIRGSFNDAEDAWIQTAEGLGEVVKRALAGDLGRIAAGMLKKMDAMPANSNAADKGREKMLKLLGAIIERPGFGDGPVVAAGLLKSAARLLRDPLNSHASVNLGHSVEQALAPFTNRLAGTDLENFVSVLEQELSTVPHHFQSDPLFEIFALALVRHERRHGEIIRARGDRVADELAMLLGVRTEDDRHQPLVFRYKQMEAVRALLRNTSLSDEQVIATLEDMKGMLAAEYEREITQGQGAGGERRGAGEKDLWFNKPAGPELETVGARSELRSQEDPMRAVEKLMAEWDKIRGDDEKADAAKSGVVLRLQQLLNQVPADALPGISQTLMGWQEQVRGNGPQSMYLLGAIALVLSEVARWGAGIAWGPVLSKLVEAWNRIRKDDAYFRIVRTNIGIAFMAVSRRIQTDQLSMSIRELENILSSESLPASAPIHYLSAALAIVLIRFERLNGAAAPGEGYPLLPVLTALLEAKGDEDESLSLALRYGQLNGIRALLRNTSLSDQQVIDTLEDMKGMLKAEYEKEKGERERGKGERETGNEELWAVQPVGWGMAGGKWGKGKETGERSEVRSNEARSNEVRSNEVKGKEVRGSEVRSKKTKTPSLTSYFLPLTSHFLLLTSYLFPLSATPSRRYDDTPLRFNSVTTPTPQSLVSAKSEVRAWKNTDRVESFRRALAEYHRILKAAETEYPAEKKEQALRGAFNGLWAPLNKLSRPEAEAVVTMFEEEIGRTRNVEPYLEIKLEHMTVFLSHLDSRVSPDGARRIERIAVRMWDLNSGKSEEAAKIRDFIMTVFNGTQKIILPRAGEAEAAARLEQLTGWFAKMGNKGYEMDARMHIRWMAADLLEKLKSSSSSVVFRSLLRSYKNLLRGSKRVRPGKNDLDEPCAIIHEGVLGTLRQVTGNVRPEDLPGVWRELKDFYIVISERNRFRLDYDAAGRVMQQFLPAMKQAARRIPAAQLPEIRDFVLEKMGPARRRGINFHGIQGLADVLAVTAMREADRDLPSDNRAETGDKFLPKINDEEKLFHELSDYFVDGGWSGPPEAVRLGLYPAVVGLLKISASLEEGHGELGPEEIARLSGLLLKELQAAARNEKSYAFWAAGRIARCLMPMLDQMTPGDRRALAAELLGKLKTEITQYEGFFSERLEILKALQALVVFETDPDRLSEIAGASLDAHRQYYRAYPARNMASDTDGTELEKMTEKFLCDFSQRFLSGETLEAWCGRLVSSFKDDPKIAVSLAAVLVRCDRLRGAPMGGARREAEIADRAPVPSSARGQVRQDVELGVKLAELLSTGIAEGEHLSLVLRYGQLNGIRALLRNARLTGPEVTGILEDMKGLLKAQRERERNKGGGGQETRDEGKRELWTVKNGERGTGKETVEKRIGVSEYRRIGDENEIFPGTAAFPPSRRHAVTPSRDTSYFLLLTSSFSGLPASDFRLPALRSEARAADGSDDSGRKHGLAYSISRLLAWPVKLIARGLLEILTAGLALIGNFILKRASGPPAPGFNPVYNIQDYLAVSATFLARFLVREKLPGLARILTRTGFAMSVQIAGGHPEWFFAGSETGWIRVGQCLMDAAARMPADFLPALMEDLEKEAATPDGGMIDMLGTAYAVAAVRYERRGAKAVDWRKDPLIAGAVMKFFTAQKFKDWRSFTLAFRRGNAQAARDLLRNQQLTDDEVNDILERGRLNLEADWERGAGPGERGTGNGERGLWVVKDGGWGVGDGVWGVGNGERDKRQGERIKKETAKSEIRNANLVIPADRREAETPWFRHARDSRRDLVIKSREIVPSFARGGDLRSPSSQGLNPEAMDFRLKHAGMTLSLTPYSLLLTPGFFAFRLQSTVYGLRSMVSTSLTPYPLSLIPVFPGLSTSGIGLLSKIKAGSVRSEARTNQASAGHDRQSIAALFQQWDAITGNDPEANMQRMDIAWALLKMTEQIAADQLPAILNKVMSWWNQIQGDSPEANKIRINIASAVGVAAKRVEEEDRLPGIADKLVSYWDQIQGDSQEARHVRSFIADALGEVARRIAANQLPDLADKLETRLLAATDNQVASNLSSALAILLVRHDRREGRKAGAKDDPVANKLAEVLSISAEEGQPRPLMLRYQQMKAIRDLLKNLTVDDQKVLDNLEEMKGVLLAQYERETPGETRKGRTGHGELWVVKDGGWGVGGEGERDRRQGERIKEAAAKSEIRNTNFVIPALRANLDGLRSATTRDEPSDGRFAKLSRTDKYGRSEARAIAGSLKEYRQMIGELLKKQKQSPEQTHELDELYDMMLGRMSKEPSNRLPGIARLLLRALERITGDSRAAYYARRCIVNLFHYMNRISPDELPVISTALLKQYSRTHGDAYQPNETRRCIANVLGNVAERIPAGELPAIAAGLTAPWSFFAENSDEHNSVRSSIAGALRHVAARIAIRELPGIAAALLDGLDSVDERTPPGKGAGVQMLLALTEVAKRIGPTRLPLMVKRLQMKSGMIQTQTEEAYLIQWRIADVLREAARRMPAEGLPVLADELSKIWLRIQGDPARDGRQCIAAGLAVVLVRLERRGGKTIPPADRVAGKLLQLLNVERDSGIPSSLVLRYNQLGAVRVLLRNRNLADQQVIETLEDMKGMLAAQYKREGVGGGETGVGKDKG